MSKLASRPTSWSKNAGGFVPKDPMEGYMGGRPNRAQRRAMERMRRKGNKGR